MNSAPIEDVQPWTNPEKQTNEPVTFIIIKVINVSKIIGCNIRFYNFVYQKTWVRTV